MSSSSLRPDPTYNGREPGGCMSAISINDKTYHVAPEVAELLSMTSNERDFYRKLLEIIAYEHIVYRGLHKDDDTQTLSRLRRVAHEGLSVYTD